MIDSTRTLAAIRAALDPISPDSTEHGIEAATAAATDELRAAALAVASFVNKLDDGTGFFNSSSEFGRQLGAEFDEVRRVITVSGMLRSLEVNELLLVIGMAMLRLQVASGPDGRPRALLSAEDRSALERISESASATLRDADMPSDPEND